MIVLTFHIGGVCGGVVASFRRPAASASQVNRLWWIEAKVNGLAVEYKTNVNI